MHIKNILNLSSKDKVSKILNSLNSKGFYKFDSKLKDISVDEINNLISKYIKKNIQDNKSGFHKDSTNITNLNLKNDFFYNFIFNKFILNLTEKIFKPGAHKYDKYIFQFDQLNSRVIYNKAKPQSLHLDSRICGVNPLTQIQYLFYLNDVNKVNQGATQVVPGSHKLKKYPTIKDNKKAKQILGNKGNFFVIDSSIWHGSSLKTGSNTRGLITLSYNRWNMRQAFSVPYGIRNKKTINLLTKSQKYILGFYNYPEKNEKLRSRMRGLLPKLTNKI